MLSDLLLELKIEEMKQRLKSLAALYGRGHKYVLVYSQKLDKNIVEWQRRRLAG